MEGPSSCGYTVHTGSNCRQPNRRHQDHPIHSLVSELVIQIEVIVLGPAAKAAPQHVLGDSQQHGPPRTGNLASAVPALPLTNVPGML